MKETRKKKEAEERLASRRSVAHPRVGLSPLFIKALSCLIDRRGLVSSPLSTFASFAGAPPPCLPHPPHPAPPPIPLRRFPIPPLPRGATCSGAATAGAPLR